MVISSSNRSPSPMSMRPNPNPNPNSRTHTDREGVVPARKSFSGYPLGKPSIISQPRSFVPNTPANSPAEFTRRNSFSRDHEQKENDHQANSKPNGVRPRSPSVLKGSKNFMSPTISAASKINPSPRKKVLGERNEAIRTSASLTDGKFQFFTMSSLDFSDENDPKTDDTEHPKLPEKHVVESEADLVVLSPEVPWNITECSDQSLTLSEMPKPESEVKNTCSSPAVIAPLDADPSLPPYDPKTNYLSPRPQFLCYKPNPRIESYINQGIRLEDEFASESCSETEKSEATHSETSPHELEDSSSSSSTEVSSHVQEMPPSSESNPSESQEIQEAAPFEIEPRRRFFTKSNVVAFGLILLLGLIFYPVTYYPGFVKDEPHTVINLAKVNFNGFVQRTKLWSAHSVSHLSQMVDNFRGVNEFDPVIFSNLTDWAEEEDYVVEDFLLGPFLERNEDDGDHMVEDFSLSFVDEEEEMDTSVDNLVEMESTQETEEQKSLVEEGFACSDSLLPSISSRGVASSEPEKVEEDSVLPLDDGEDSKVDVEDPNVDMMGQSSPIDEAENQEVEHTQEEEASISSDAELELQNAESSSSQLPCAHNTQVEDISPEYEFESQNDDKPENHFSSDDPQVQPEETTEEVDGQSIVDNIEIEETTEEVKIDSEVVPEVTATSTELPLLSEMTTVGLAVVTLLVSTAAVVVYAKKPKKASPAEKTMMEKSVASAKEPSMVHECPSSWNGPDEVDMSEPCASEMSSFQKTSSHTKKNAPRKGSDEAQSQSQERRHPRRDYSKRESIASSSSEYTMCSSYGSFTTYSIMPSKKGDDEVVTPVRRSSRIRKQVTSP